MGKILRDRLRRIALSTALAAIGTATTLGADQTLLLYGDSLMAGLGLAQEHGFAAQLQQALGDDVAIVNASVSGDTSTDGLARLDWSLSDRPDAVVLELGANDMLQGLDVAGMRQNLTAILERFSTEGIPVLLMGMKASPGLGREYVRAYDAAFADLAAQFDVALYPFFLEGVALDPSLNQADGMHPNAQGVVTIVTHVLPAVRELLAQAGP